MHTPVISALYSLYEYHKEALTFGVGLRTPHPYQSSQPWDWLLVTRPVAFFYECYTGPVAGPSHYCPSGYKGAEWSQEVLGPAPRRSGGGRCWPCCSAWAGGCCTGTGGPGRCCSACWRWAPWFPLVTRTKFYYYALEFEPFLILSIVLCLGPILGPATASALRRATGALIVGAYVLCVLLMFWYFYSILAGQVIPYQDWLHHMWYRIGRGWI